MNFSDIFVVTVSFLLLGFVAFIKTLDFLEDVL